jgi:hypothetical protein
MLNAKYPRIDCAKFLAGSQAPVDREIEQPEPERARNVR